MSIKTTTEEFINKSMVIYNNNYDYTNVVYINNKKEVIIKCNKCGESFTQTPNKHLGKVKPNCGCSGKLNTKKFIQRALLINRNSEYDYSNVNYIDSYTKVIIICNECKMAFEQMPHNHLYGYGCLNCKGRRKLTIEKFCNRANEIHVENLYDYSKVEYINATTNVTILCNNCNKYFKQTPITHLNGSGCSKCCGGFSVNIPAILYYIKIEKDNRICYKIGITNRTVLKRFGTDMKYIKILKVEKFEDGQKAFDKEYEILNNFKEYKYVGEKILKSGNTELFIKDVLELDN